MYVGDFNVTPCFLSSRLSFACSQCQEQGVGVHWRITSRVWVIDCWCCICPGLVMFCGVYTCLRVCVYLCVFVCACVFVCVCMRCVCRACVHVCGIMWKPGGCLLTVVASHVDLSAVSLSWSIHTSCFSSAPPCLNLHLCTVHLGPSAVCVCFCIHR